MNYLDIAQSVLEMESKALKEAALRLKKEEVEEIVKLYDHLRSFEGQLIFCGVGKSGIIAKKLASTFASLGQPSSFLHPVEALHGDLGRVRKEDVVVFLSKSGTTEEILKLMPFLDIPQEQRVGLLGAVKSPVAENCSLVFDCSVEKEACLNNQAPTTSSTLALAMGDALAVVYESFVGLSKESYAVNHPGGLLGKKMRIKVKDLMWSPDKCPVLKAEALLKDAILAMTQKPLGACAVVDDGQKLLGILVEGDIRRAFTKEGQGLETNLLDLAQTKPIVIDENALAYEALVLMEKRERPIDVLPVVKDETFLGFIRLHDLFKEGFLLES